METKMFEVESMGRMPYTALMMGCTGVTLTVSHGVGPEVDLADMKVGEIGVATFQKTGMKFPDLLKIERLS